MSINIGLNKFWSIASLPNLRFCFFMGVSVLASSCAAPPASVAQRPNAPSAAVAFDAAIDYAVDDILVQAQRLPEFQPPTKNAVEAATRAVFANIEGSGFTLPDDLPGWLRAQRWRLRLPISHCGSGGEKDRRLTFCRLGWRW